jgi:XTP/dITP diphosphohydrolase
MAKLLRKLEGIENRKARFRTVIALLTHPQSLPKGGKCEVLSSNNSNENPSPREGNRVGFEGIVNGSIIRERRGGEGFGYDPIFQPEGYDKTFAELGSEIKNHISHRARAVQKLADFLKSL